MVRHRGVGASDGIAVGPAHLVDRRVEVQARRIAKGDIDAELRRFDEALAASDAQLEAIQVQLAAQEGDKHHFRILEVHRLMLGDVQLVEHARRLIRDELVVAEWAVRRALDQIQAVFDRIEDPYFRDRRSDVAMVGERLLRNLVGRGDAAGHEEAPPGCVAVGHDLSPADVTQLKRAGVIAFCTEGGGKTSHSAIVARALGLPYVVGVPDLTRRICPGVTVIVDGGRGEVIVDPTPEARRVWAERAARQQARNQTLSALRDQPAATACDVRVRISANLELLEEIPAVIEIGADAVGLFRTEFLYLGRSDLPSEEEQYVHAVHAIQALQGRRPTFRTLDLGGDKLPASVSMPAGNNPVLGLRSIRYSLQRRDIFRTQLRALYRAAAVGPLRIMFPLISGVGELREAKAVCKEVSAELAREGIPHDPNVPLGSMIETPSAALIADLLACECEFLSIGTNDLIQYALAADRENEHVAYLYHPLHPAIIRAIKQVVDGARQMGTEVAMCGDMAGDPSYVWILLGLGLRELSMAPRQIPVMKAVIRATRLSEAEALTARAMELRTEQEVDELVNGVMRARFPLELGAGDEDRGLEAVP